jgi:hypothetical protein
MKVGSQIGLKPPRNIVIPAKAGNQTFQQMGLFTVWIPAFAGMTRFVGAKDEKIISEIKMPFPPIEEGLSSFYLM